MGLRWHRGAEGESVSGVKTVGLRHIDCKQNKRRRAQFYHMKGSTGTLKVCKEPLRFLTSLVKLYDKIRIDKDR